MIRKKLDIKKGFIFVLLLVLFDQLIKFYIKLNFPLTLYNQPAIIDLGFFKLLFIEKYVVGGESMRSYVYDLKEYPTRIKKLYIKGNSEKKVPTQMLNIQTNTIETNPEVYFNRFGNDIEFEADWWNT